MNLLFSCVSKAISSHTVSKLFFLLFTWISSSIFLEFMGDFAGWRVCQCSLNVNNTLTSEPIRQNWNSWGVWLFFFFSVLRSGVGFFLLPLSWLINSSERSTAQQRMIQQCNSKAWLVVVHLSQEFTLSKQTSESVLGEIGRLLTLSTRSLGLWTSIWHMYWTHWFITTPSVLELVLSVLKLNT